MAVLVRLPTSCSSGRAGDLVHDRGHRRLQRLDRRRHGGDDRDRPAGVEFGRRRVGGEGEVDEQLAGEQVAGLQLRPQATLDQLGHAAVLVGRPARRLVKPPGTSRCGSISMPTGMRILSVAGSNSSATLVTSPTVMPRNSTGAPGLEPAHRAVEMDQEGDLLGELGLRQRRSCWDTAGSWRRRRRPRRRWCPSGVSNSIPPTISDCSEPTWTSMPEAPVATLMPLAFQNRLVVRTSSLVGRPDEDRDVQAPLVRGELVVQHLADLDAAVEDRGARADRAQARGGQRVLAGRPRWRRSAAAAPGR